MNIDEINNTYMLLLALTHLILQPINNKININPLILFATSHNLQCQKRDNIQQKGWPLGCLQAMAMAMAMAAAVIV